MSKTTHKSLSGIKWNILRNCFTLQTFFNVLPMWDIYSVKYRPYNRLSRFPCQVRWRLSVFPVLLSPNRTWCLAVSYLWNTPAVAQAPPPRPQLGDISATWLWNSLDQTIDSDFPLRKFQGRIPYGPINSAQLTMVFLLNSTKTASTKHTSKQKVMSGVANEPRNYSNTVQWVNLSATEAINGRMPKGFLTI